MGSTDMDVRIPFNKPFVVGTEAAHVQELVASGELASDGKYTGACSQLLKERLGVARVEMMPSCTAALEAAALLCALQPGDEVILPSFTFASTANAFVRCGACPVFVDIRADTLNLDETQLEGALTEKTKAIVPVHYAGVGCEMEAICEIARPRKIFVVEDAAQAVGAQYKGKALGTWGDLGAFSFHSTKNYVCGEGGALAVNDVQFGPRLERIRDKGTSRQEFLRGEVERYTWVDVGSSFVPTELASAYLLGQLECWDDIADRRARLFRRYEDALKGLEHSELVRLPQVPEHCESNAHTFFVVTRSSRERDGLRAFLDSRGIQAVSHYEPLHASPMARRLGAGNGRLPVTEEVAARILRLPLYPSLESSDVDWVCEEIQAYFRAPV